MKNLTLPIRFGIVTSAVLIAYFLILSLVGKHTNVFYSLFNGVITGFGIYEAIKYLRIQNRDTFNYGRGFSAGIVTIFFAFYATELDSAFLDKLSSAWSGDYKNFQGIVFFTVAIMGFATTLVLTLSFMQLFKTSNNSKKIMG